MFANYNRRFWARALERAIKSAAQAFILATVGLKAMAEAGVEMQVQAWNVNWWQVLGFTVGGFILSIATSVGSEPFGPEETPSVVP